jgi:hypothetical protein
MEYFNQLSYLFGQIQFLLMDLFGSNLSYSARLKFIEIFTYIFLKLIPFLILSFFFYFFNSRYEKIAIKNNQKDSKLAWFPLFGPIVVAFKASKLSWQYLLVFFLIPIMWYFLLINLNVFVFILYAIIALYSAVFFIVIHYKMFKAVEKPGMWAINPLIVGVIISLIGWLVSRFVLPEVGSIILSIAILIIFIILSFIPIIMFGIYLNKAGKLNSQEVYSRSSLDGQ